MFLKNNICLHTTHGTARKISGSTWFWPKKQGFWRKKRGLEEKPVIQETSHREGFRDKFNMANKSVASELSEYTNKRVNCILGNIYLLNKWKIVWSICMPIPWYPKMKVRLEKVDMLIWNLSHVIQVPIKHLHHWLDPKLGHGTGAICWIPCACVACTIICTSLGPLLYYIVSIHGTSLLFTAKIGLCL